MSKPVAEKYVGEILMETKDVPAKFWDFVITDKGFRLIFFSKPSLFEIVIMILVWLLIFWGAVVSGFDRFATESLLLLVVGIYILNRYRIKKRWEKLLQTPLEKKLYSNKQNVHIQKDDVRRIIYQKKAIIIATKKDTYRLRYFESLGKIYKFGIDPFERRKEKEEEEEFLSSCFT